MRSWKSFLENYGEEKMSETGKPLFSIVVPVYKVEPYLDRCVDSLVHQTVDPEQLEILLVDDGSPDRVAPCVTGMQKSIPS